MDVLQGLKDMKISINLLKNIQNKKDVNVSIMEVCGSHTNAIMRMGLKSILPKNIKLISGPGCPVCVTEQMYIDIAISLCKIDNLIITTFGDLMRVPGSVSTLMEEKSKGKDIRVVYSPLDALQIAKDNLDKKIVFLAIGFETTAPIIALSMKKAVENNIDNYFLLNGLKTMPKVMEKLALDSNVKIDGFLCPGNVATIIGEIPFKNFSDQYKIPMVISGFENNDILASLYKLIEMKEKQSYGFINMYTRLVKPQGNKVALSIMEEVFENCNSTWRGIGEIVGGGLKLRDKYEKMDIMKEVNISINIENEINGCICGDILMGIVEPIQCKLFRNTCMPQNPIGPCMVSEEGTCAVYYKYR